MKILVAPLDWGLGHATRCIPIISELINQGNEVIIAADGDAEKLLRQEFSELKFVSIRGYHIKYSSFLPMSFMIFLQLPGFIRTIFREHYRLKKVVRDHEIDVVISDNRYGLWNRKIHSVFLTHQLMIKCPAWLRFLEPLLYRANKFFINRYDECWIPDDKNKLSGDLSHRFPVSSRVKFIGPLSRWKETSGHLPEKKYDLIAVLSGPEPHRSSLEKIMLDQLCKSKLKSLLVLGKPAGHFEKKISSNVSLVSYLNSSKLFEAVSSADLVICRSGYSSIMDLISIKKNAVLIPTPGQTEQLYLADHLHRKNLFYSISEKQFKLEEALLESKKYSVKNLEENNSDLASMLKKWKSSVNEW